VLWLDYMVVQGVDCEDAPSFVHAAVSGVRMAKRPREIAENFMMALSHGRKALCADRHRLLDFSLEDCWEEHAGLLLLALTRVEDLRTPPRPAV